MANADKLNDGKLIKRSKRVSFLNVGTTDEPKFIRMQGFSSMSESKSAKEYSRQYVDEDTERSDVVGYATQIGYSFDGTAHTQYMRSWLKSRTTSTPVPMRPWKS